MRHEQDQSDLAKAFAAFFATLIAAIAQHAAEHPLLAPSLRMSIRQIEKLSRQLEAMATEWQATRHQPERRRAGFSPPPPRARHIAPRQHGEAAPSRRPFAALWHPAFARAPPRPDSALSATS